MSVQQVVIEYRRNGTQFEVVLSAKSIDIFEKAARQPYLKDKEGEDLVTALVAHAKGGIFKVERFKEGSKNDGPNGEPAMLIINDYGLVSQVRRYKDFMLNDGKNGEPASQDFNDQGVLIAVKRYKADRLEDGRLGPAVQEFTSRGVLVRTERYRGGELNDSAHGEPAVLKQFETGQVRHIERYRDGVLTDGIAGEPAVLSFAENGKPVSGERYTNGVLTKTLTEQELQDSLSTLDTATRMSNLQAAFEGKLKVRGYPPNPNITASAPRKSSGKQGQKP